MVRLRRLGSEFHGPEDLETGAILTMPYLRDFWAFQEYVDGDLSALYARHSGNATQRNITGARYYSDPPRDGVDPAGDAAYIDLNLFRSVVRYFQAAVFERSPTVLDDDEAAQKLWEQYAPRLLREARKAVAWQPSKGRGVLVIENRYPGVPVPMAVDPQFYLPIVDRVNRDLTVGHALIRLWYEGRRLPEQRIPNRATVQIWVSAEDADMSDGRLAEMNETRTFIWGGDDATGTLGGTLESEISRADNARLQGLWTFGDDDSLFATMERGVYECILALTHARTALTQDVRATRVVPQVIDPRYQNADGTLKLDLLDPQFQLAVDDIAGAGTALGYQDPPGPVQSAAFQQFYELLLNNLAYTANIPPEAFGLNYMNNEPAEALTKLQQVFKTQVVDVRDDLSTILSEMFALLTGRQGVNIGWSNDPFEEPSQNDARIQAIGDILTLDEKRALAGYPPATPEQQAELQGGMDNGIDQRAGGEEPSGEPGRERGEPRGSDD